MAALLPSKPSTRQRIFKFGPPLQPTGETSKAGKGPTNDFVAGARRSTRLTQEDQDKSDEEKQEESMLALVQTWMDSLQLISVITTFFVSTEASLLGIIVSPPTHVGLSTAGQVANIGLMGALVVHAHAAVISFLGAFFLVRYKLTVAQKKEEEVEGQVLDSPTSISSNDLENAKGLRTSPYTDDLSTDPVHGLVRANSPLSGNKIIWSTNPHLVQVGPFNQGQPPTELLARCHSLSVFLSSIGFLLALMGLLSFAWDQLPLSASVFASVSMGFCLVAGVLILIIPSTKTSHIYCHYKSP